MRWLDVYVIVCVGAAVFTLAAVVGWLVDHWDALTSAWFEYRRRSADLRRVTGSPSYRGFSGPRREVDPSPRPRNR